jgi:DNA-binding transcriptional LysR family regulator
MAAVAAGLGWAITTPLCIMESGLPLDGMKIAALPGPSLNRHLTLVSRGRELGPLPKQIADLAGAVLKKKCRPFLDRHCPWIAGGFLTGPAAAI